MRDRKRLALRLGLSETEIFICERCKRRFFLDITLVQSELGRERVRWLSSRIVPSYPRLDICGECHANHLFHPGETFLEE